MKLIQVQDTAGNKYYPIPANGEVSTGFALYSFQQHKAFIHYELDLSDDTLEQLKKVFGDLPTHPDYLLRTSPEIDVLYYKLRQAIPAGNGKDIHNIAWSLLMAVYVPVWELDNNINDWLRACPDYALADSDVESVQKHIKDTRQALQANLDEIKGYTSEWFAEWLKIAKQNQVNPDDLFLPIEQWIKQYGANSLNKVKFSNIAGVFGEQHKEYCFGRR